MTNTLLKISTLKEKMNEKQKFCNLVIKAWCNEHDKEIIPDKWLAVKEALEGYKKMWKELAKLENDARMAGIGK